MLLDNYFIKVGGVSVCVPQLFEWDGASIPRYGWQITYTPFNPILALPSLVHDWFFYNHQVDLKTANDIFYLLLLDNGVPKWKAKIMYKAVEIGGPSRWDNGPEEKAYLKKLYALAKFNPSFNLYHFPMDQLE